MTKKEFNKLEIPSHCRIKYWSNSHGICILEQVGHFFKCGWDLHGDSLPIWYSNIVSIEEIKLLYINEDDDFGLSRIDKDE